ncbi:type II toxin-antitoxin system ParD family antitoxin [Colwelliaceae bacterium BS250]
MSKFSITMSDDLGEYVQDAIKAKYFDNISEYFRHLVRQDLLREQSDKELRSLIDSGLKSGVSNETVGSIWAEAIKESVQ